MPLPAPGSAALSGETMVTSTGDETTATVLQDRRFVGLYFAASWNEACVKFTVCSQHLPAASLTCAPVWTVQVG